VNRPTLRRSLFGAATVAIATAIPAFARASVHPDAELLHLGAEFEAAGSHPDADLIATCAAFDAYDKECEAIYARIDDDDEMYAAAQPLTDRLHALLDRMDGLLAVTADGILARAGEVGDLAPPQVDGFGLYTFETVRLAAAVNASEEGCDHG
jgi:hypothetical protein